MDFCDLVEKAIRSAVRFSSQFLFSVMFHQIPSLVLQKYNFDAIRAYPQDHELQHPQSNPQWRYPSLGSSPRSTPSRSDDKGSRPQRMRPLTLTADANLLWRLKVEKNLAWKDIQIQFLDLRKKGLKIPALQMRYTRLMKKWEGLGWEEA